jgi:hypothetical protein
VISGRREATNSGRRIDLLRPSLCSASPQTWEVSEPTSETGNTKRRHANVASFVVNRCESNWGPT